MVTIMDNIMENNSANNTFIPTDRVMYEDKSIDFNSLVSLIFFT